MANQRERGKMNEQKVDHSENDNNQSLIGAIFLTGVTGMSVLFGFGMTLAMAKRRDPKFFTKGLIKSREEGILESGGALAARALGRATLYAVGGFSAFLIISWKLLGLNNIKELPEKMKKIMPAVPQPTSTGRTEFKSIRELMEYLITTDEKEKKLSVDDQSRKK